LWASQPQCSKPLWRRRGPGSGSAPGGLGCAVEDAWPGTGSGSVDGGPWPKSCGKSGEGQVRVPIGPLAGCQKTLTQTPQHPPKQHRGLRNGCPSVDHTIPTVMTAAAPPPSGLSISTNPPLPLPLRAPGAVRDRRHVGVARQSCFKIPRRARIAVKTKPPVTSS
jgi:hypothetical protein